MPESRLTFRLGASERRMIRRRRRKRRKRSLVLSRGLARVLKISRGTGICGISSAFLHRCHMQDLLESLSRAFAQGECSARTFNDFSAFTLKRDDCARGAACERFCVRETLFCIFASLVRDPSTSDCGPRSLNGPMPPAFPLACNSVNASHDLTETTFASDILTLSLPLCLAESNHLISDI